MLTRALLSAGLLLLAALAFAPAASADDVHACIGTKPAECANNDVLIVDYNGARVLDVCVIAVAGSCNPYSGDLVRAHVLGLTVRVPDPCYTTACF